MATVTIRRIERVVVVHMAGRAGRRRRGHVRSGQGEPGDAVIERRRGPAGRRMASGAIRRGKSGAGSGVHRIIRLLPGGQMALRVSAIGRRDRQSVVVVDVARSAGHVGVPVGQQEIRSCCGRMSPSSSSPSCGRSSSSQPQTPHRPTGARDYWSAARSSNGIAEFPQSVGAIVKL